MVEIGSLAPGLHSIIQKKGKRQHLIFKEVTPNVHILLSCKTAYNIHLETDHVPHGEVSVPLLTRKGEWYVR